MGHMCVSVRVCRRICIHIPMYYINVSLSLWKGSFRRGPTHRGGRREEEEEEEEEGGG